jgi:hypothetical protein
MEFEILILGLPSPSGVGVVIDAGAAVGKMKSLLF